MTDTKEMTMTIGGGAAVDPGTYEAVLSALEDFQYEDKDGEGTKTLRRWTFTLENEVDTDGQLVTIDGVSSLATGPKSKAFGWLGALLGRAPVTGESFTPSMLVGRSCMVTVELNTEGFSKVAAVVPPPKRRATSDAAPSVTPVAVPAAPEAFDGAPRQEPAPVDALPF